MRERKLIFAVFFVILASVDLIAQSNIQPRITQSIDEQKLVRLTGNTHPLAQARFDQGAAPDSLPAHRMLLLLQRGPDQEAALQILLEEQQTRSSPSYHHWLSPQEFGQQFGPADVDIATVTTWLQMQGFRVNKVGAGRTVIEFSGTAGQVRQAFHTEIHKFVTNGEDHWANASDPQIPAALAPVLGGIVSLHNFRKRPAVRIGKSISFTQAKPLLTTTSGCGPTGTDHCYVVGPGDFAKIYNVLPLWNATPPIDGTGQSIAIVARTNINLQDVRDFRTLFGLPANDPQVILDGPDPGLIPGDETEALLDVQLAGSVAKGATIDLVVSEGTEVVDGVDLSSIYAIDNNVAGVLSLSFGACELFLGTAGNNFYKALWQQAAAQGITVTVSAGDAGSAGCDDFNTQTTATNGLAVNGLASTPFNVAVGGTDFDDVGNFSTYWSTVNQPGNRTSALSYIPELTLNDSCAQQGVSGGCTSPPGSQLQNIFAGGGGPSNCSTSSTGGLCLTGTGKPVWQTGSGVPADNVRDTPDISLFGGDGENSSFYLVCEADFHPPNSCANGHFLGVGGTSGSVQAFGGIMALVNHKMASLGLGSRQGNANFVLYPLAATNGASCDSSNGTSNPSTCIFYDTTKGNNSVPCSGTKNCGNVGGNVVMVDPSHPSTPAWTTTPGFDLATGLGSVNVANLANNWNSISFKGTTTMLAGLPMTPITHGQSVNLTITVAAKPPATGTPTGAVGLMGGPNNTQLGIDGFALTNGTTGNVSTKLLPGGTYPVFARYAGDGTFGASDSALTAVTVNPEASKTFLSLLTFDLSGNLISATATTAAYGSPYILRADVGNSSASAAQLPTPLCNPNPIGETPCPTGNVVITANGAPLDAGTFKLNSAGFAEDQPIQLSAGNYAMAAQYSGDNSFNPSNAALNVTITQAQTGAAVGADPSTGITTATQVTLTAIVSTQSNSTVGPSGTVTFFNNGTQIGSPVQVTSSPATATTFAGATASLMTTFTTAGNESITAKYNGDTNYAASPASSALPLTVAQAQTGSFTVSGSATTATAGGAAVTSTITLTPSGGFTGSVAVNCTSLPPGVTCDPLNITVSGSGAATGQLTVHVAGPSAPGTTADLRLAERTEYASLQGPPTSRNSWWKLSAGTGLVAIFLLLVPGRRRYRSTLALWLICMLSFAMGCGGGSSGGAVVGPAATITKLTVPQTKAPSGTALNFNVSVTSSGAAPTGMVQLFDGATAVGGPLQVAGGGAATVIVLGSLSVGTHQVSAHYLGDANTSPSASGTVNVTVTGTATVGIATTPASSNNGSFNLTIN